MANIFEWGEKKQAWQDWLKDQSDIIRSLAERFPPNKLYLLNSGHRVTIYSYHEDGTLTVSVTGKYNVVMFERNVFGIKPKDLVECDLPDENTPVGNADIPIEVVRELYLQATKHERN